MLVLNGWQIKRAGDAMTITHGTGKITGVVWVGRINGKVAARSRNGTYYELEMV